MLLILNMAYGNQKRRHGNIYYGAKYAARAVGAYGAYTSGIGSSKWGWKKGGKMFKRMFGGIRGPRARLAINNRRSYNTGSNTGHRTGSNPKPGKKYTGGYASRMINWDVGGRAKSRYRKYK